MENELESLYYQILDLNSITYGESLYKNEKRWSDYKHTAMLWLNHQFKFLTASEIKAQYASDRDIKEILGQNKERFIPGAMIEVKEGKREQVYYDIWAKENISNTDSFFPFFFSCRITHIDLLDIDHFLNSHLIHNFDSDKKKFFRFLELIIRRYKYLLNEDITETIKEWQKLKESEPELSGANEATEEKVKGRMQRENGDKLTSLSLVQTALLIQFLQQNNIILKGSYLTFTQAGKAFNLLTGYSAHTLRQQLGTKGTLEGVKYEDYKELHEIITKLAKSIEEKIRKKG